MRMMTFSQPGATFITWLISSPQKLVITYSRSFMFQSYNVVMVFFCMKRGFNCSGFLQFLGVGYHSMLAGLYGVKLAPSKSAFRQFWNSASGKDKNSNGTGFRCSDSSKVRRLNLATTVSFGIVMG